MFLPHTVNICIDFCQAEWCLEGQPWLEFLLTQLQLAVIRAVARRLHIGLSSIGWEHLLWANRQTFCQTGCSTHGPNFVWFLLIYLRIKHTIEIGCLKTSNLSPLSLIHYMNLIDQTGLWLNSFDTVCWKNLLKPEKKKQQRFYQKQS